MMQMSTAVAWGSCARLLWEAWGISRPQAGKRKAPRARNWHEIDVLVVTAAGAYVRDAAPDALEYPMLVKAVVRVQEA